MIDSAVAAIDCELKIVEMELAHPERFVRPERQSPLAKWNGSISELLEMAIPVHCSGKIAKPTGEQMAYSDVVALIENVFGQQISRPYERKSKLLARKKDETPFLHKLISVFRTEVEKSLL